MSCKILVGNLDTETNEEGVRNFFMPIMSQIMSVEVPVDPKTGKNRGYAYVELRTNLQAQNAVRDLHGKLSLGRNMTLTLVEETIATKRKWYQFG